jgi:hypothetical protein
MFSLEGAPGPVEPATPPATFEGDRAAAQARQIVAAAPEREPGSPGDLRVADIVATRFEEIPAGAVTQQELEVELDDETVSTRNVLLTLPGDVNSTVVVLAARDTARGVGATSSAAATGILIELANALGVAGREKTFVLASTSGSVAGAAGARELLDQLPERDTVEAVIVISQPGAREPSAPYVVTSSTDADSGSVQLERTAELAVATQAQRESSEQSAFGQLARLAIPSGLGEQAPLVGAGIDAVAISAAGERPQAEAEATLEQLGPASVDAFGRAVQSTVDAVDVAPGAPAHGPGTHLELSDNLVPGWTLALLAFTLILPAAIAAIDAGARCARRRLGLGAGIGWAAARALPFVGALLALYALALVGAIPRPPFPFDPQLHELDAGAAIALALVGLAGVASGLLLLRLGRAAPPPPAGAAGLGAVAVLAVALVWLVNPYLALLLAPAAHVWLLAAAPGGPGRAAIALVAAALACVPGAAALVSVASSLELGGDAPWTFALMVADGQIALAIMVAGCLLAGSVSGAIGLAARRDSRFPSDL